MPASDKERKRPFLTDLPLGEKKGSINPFLEERLEFKSYATVVAQAAMDTENFLTIGVFGKRGSGKTSLMRLAKSLVDSKPELFITVWFNAWQYDHEKHLIVPLIVSLSKGLEDFERSLGGKITPKLSEGVGALCTALQSLLYGFCVKDNLSIPDLPEPGSGLSSEEIVNNCIEFTKDYILVRRLYLDAFSDLRRITRDDKIEKPRMVVFIDDLDRCHPDRVMDLLKAVNLVLGQPGFSFVIGIHPQIFRSSSKKIQQQEYNLEEDQAEDYIEKMIHVPVHIPEQDPESLQEYIREMILNIQVFPATISRDQMDNIIRVICEACENNPRSIVRFLNSLLVSVRSGEFGGSVFDILGLLLSRILIRERYRPLFLALQQGVTVISATYKNPVNLGQAVADILEESQKNMAFLSQTLQTLQGLADIQPQEKTKKALQVLIENPSLCQIFFTESGLRWLRDSLYRASTGKAITTIREQPEDTMKKREKKISGRLERGTGEAIHDLAKVQMIPERPEISEQPKPEPPFEAPVLPEPVSIPEISSLPEQPLPEEAMEKKEPPKPGKRVKEFDPMSYLIALTLSLVRYKTLRAALEQDAMVISRDKQISKKLSRTIADTLEKSKEKKEEVSKTSQYFLETAGMQPEGLAPKALRILAADQYLSQIFSSERGIQWLRNPASRTTNLDTPPLEQLILREAGYPSWPDVLQKVERERNDPVELLLTLTLFQPQLQFLRLALYEGTAVYRPEDNITLEFGNALADIFEQAKKTCESSMLISQRLKNLAAEQPDDLARAALELLAEKSHLFDFISLDLTLKWLRDLNRNKSSGNAVDAKPGTSEDAIGEKYWAEIQHKVMEGGVDPLAIRAILDDVKKNNTLPEFAKPYIRTLEPLRELKELPALSLKRCIYVRDLEPLSDLQDLNKLDLAECAGILSLDPLEKLKNLEWLELSGCKGINDLKPLCVLKGLKHLSLSGCSGIVDLEPLKSLTAMEWLDLTECRGIVDLKPLENMNKLQWLDLTRLTELTNLGSLAHLRSLSRLYLNGCAGLTDLVPLENAPSLKGLYLKECANLSNLKPLAKLRFLEIIDLTNCTLIRDLSPLAHIRSLGRIRIVGTGVDINGIPGPLREKIMV